MNLFFEIFMAVYIATLFSCEPSNFDKSQKNIPDSAFIRDIPKDNKGKIPSYYYKKEELEKKLGLASLESGIDSFEIRIYYGVALSNIAQAIIINKSDSEWKASLLHLTYNYNEKGDSLLSVSKIITSKRPKSGWNDLLDSLYKLKIMTIRDAVELPNYEDCNDGYGMTIEIASKTKYRIYNYPCFNSQPHNIWQAKNIALTLELLEREFDFQRIIL